SPRPRGAARERKRMLGASLSRKRTLAILTGCTFLAAHGSRICTCARRTTFPSSCLRQPAGGGHDQREDCQRMTRQYEAVYVFDSTLEDAAITDKLGKLHTLLGNPG